MGVKMTWKYFERKQKYLLFKLNKDLNRQIKTLKSAFNEFKNEGNASSLCFRKMVWLTVFLKRYVNLFLICQSGESVTADEIRLCLWEFSEKIKWFPGVRTFKLCEGCGEVLPETAFFICKLWIFLLEWAGYMPDFVQISINDGQKAVLTIESPIILNKSSFLTWLLQRESLNSEYMEISEKKEGKRLSVSLICHKNSIKENTDLYDERKYSKKVLKNSEDSKYSNRLTEPDIYSKPQYLNLKMRLHREFGDCMQAGYLYMIGDEIVNKEIIICMWRRLIKNLMGNTITAQKIDEKKELSQLAALFHCTLHLPKKNLFKEMYESVFYFCIREAMMNAIRHGSATEVFITQERVKDKIKISIFDNGTGLKIDFNEGGGISGIRAYLNKKGIPLYIDKEQGTLVLSFLL